MRRRTTLALALLIAAALTATALVNTRPGSARSEAADSYTLPFFRQLAATRTERKAQVISYFHAARRQAEGTVRDTRMMGAFKALLGQDRPLDSRSELALDAHYVNHYGDFFDILFVDRTGYVFHSIRRESDYHRNLFEGPLSGTKLSTQLPTVRVTTFVDYEFYPPSDELAAFFAVPVTESAGGAATATLDGLLGWIVLQCPLNKLNSICTDRRGLGRTGEVYLVNTERRMVTDSRFRPEPAELTLRVDTLAVAEALAAGVGQRIVPDYRGVPVLSSFERFEVFGTPWVILAEIDEAEAITEFYRRNKAVLQDQIYDLAASVSIDPCQTAAPAAPPKRVDMNEYARALCGQALVTNGVAACTAVAAVLPGRFGYLAHIGPTDRIYGHSDQGHNDRLSEMLRQLQHYDVYPSQMAELRFTIAAVHERSFLLAVDRLLDLGIELAQIRFACHPTARYANVLLGADAETVWIEWNHADGASTTVRASDIEDLGALLKRVCEPVGQVAQTPVKPD